MPLSTAVAGALTAWSRDVEPLRDALLACRLFMQSSDGAHLVVRTPQTDPQDSAGMASHELYELFCLSDAENTYGDKNEYHRALLAEAQTLQRAYEAECTYATDVWQDAVRCARFAACYGTNSVSCCLLYTSPSPRDS